MEEKIKRKRKQQVETGKGKERMRPDWLVWYWAASTQQLLSGIRFFAEVMAGWGPQGTCQHILPHEPYVLCHNCQKRFGVVRMVCGCGLAKSIRRQECVSFNCADMPRIKKKKIKLARRSSPVPATLSWKEMFIYNKRANLWIAKPNWQPQVIWKNQFECLSPPPQSIQAASAGSVAARWWAAHTVLGEPDFWREAGSGVWELLVPARNRQMFTGGCHTVRLGAELPQCFIGFFFFCLHVSGTMRTSVWKPWPILGYTSS